MPFRAPVPNLCVSPERTIQNAQVPTFSFLTTILITSSPPRAIDHAGSSTLYIGEGSEKKRFWTDILTNFFEENVSRG